MTTRSSSAGRLLYPILEGMDLLAAVAEAFGLPTTFKDRDGFVEQFRRFVADSAAAGRRVLLIVDEAQRLNRELLVELGRLPYADGPGGAASLSVLFVGQRGLLDALRADTMEPDVLCHLRPLTREQTADYAPRRRLASLAGAAGIVLILAATWAVKRSDWMPGLLAGPAATTASTVTDAAPAIEGDSTVASDATSPSPGATAEPNDTVAAASPPTVPERPRRPLSVASRPATAPPAAKSPRTADDAGDATSIIDWLLEGRGAGGGASID